MKKLLGTMFVLLVAFSIQAQKKSTPQISGKVQDSLTGKPVEGAVIWLGKRAALTDATGFFSMDASGIPTSEFSIAATGYTTLQVKLLNSSLSNSLHFLLVPESNLLQPLEVTAVRAAATAPFAKTNINKEIGRAHV